MDREGTARAVALQLAAMGCERFELGLHTQRGQMQLRNWSGAEVEKVVPWLTWMNGRDKGHGNDIFIRPLGSVGLLLVDDLPADALARLAQDGLVPAVVVETSPANHQAWIRVSEEPIPAALATAAAKLLAKRYGGDPASADWRHFGRLAGFANLKPERRLPDGTHPSAGLLYATGFPALHGEALLAEADAALRSPAQSSPIQRGSTFPRALNGWEPGPAYEWYAQRITHGRPATDPSRLDWIVLCNIASANLAVDQAYLEQALLDGSPNLAQRKVGHLEHYVAHTAAKVLGDAHVMAARKELSARSL